MNLEDRLRESRRDLDDVRRELSQVNYRRARRRARAQAAERNEVKRDKLELMEDKSEALEDLARLEDRLDSLPGGDPRELAIAAEIDLLEREIDVLGVRIARHRDKQQNKTKRLAALEEERRKRKRRRGNLEKRERAIIKRIDDIVDEIEERREENQSDWPATLILDECLYHLGHFHLASRERSKLITVCRIGQEKWGLRIGEFPPFDPVECVHVDPGSWHYRDSSSPFTSRGCAGRGDGLATDINHLANETIEVAFYREVVRRYG